MTEPEIVIRPASVADGEMLLGLIDELADYEALERPTPDARDRLLQDAFGPAPRFQAYIAEFAGRPIGYAITFETYSTLLALPTLYLEDLFVLPDFRRHGAGGAFFRFLAGEAVRRGCGRMDWAVLDWNQLAIDFYLKLGARHVKAWHTYRLTADQLQGTAGN